MARWLVTGGSGFLGMDLLRYLFESFGHELEIIAVGRRLPPGCPPSQYRYLDFNTFEDIQRSIRVLQPAVVLHLGGLTPPGPSEGFFRINTAATIRIVEALKVRTGPVRLVVAGSAAELGTMPIGQLPATESTICRPIGAYGLSKWFGSYYAQHYSAPTEAVVARIFNPIGPGMPRSLAFGRFASQLASSVSDPLKLSVRNLDAIRDFVDLRDVARAVLSLALNGRAGSLYNVGSGIPRTISEGLELLIKVSGRSVEVEGPKPLMAAHRQSDHSCGSIHKIKSETGWSPQIPFDQSILDLWNSANQHENFDVCRRSKTPA